MLQVYLGLHMDEILQVQNSERYLDTQGELAHPTHKPPPVFRRRWGLSRGFLFP